MGWCAEVNTQKHTLNLRTGRIQTPRLRELGTSLADIAAFMQEIELQQGFFTPKVDGRGIERLRFLALQFEGMSETTDNVSPSSLSCA
jgi:hypothetical protein